MWDLSGPEVNFFGDDKDYLAVYEKIMDKLSEQYPLLSVKVGKTAISLRNKYVFATVSKPWRRVKDWPDRYVQLAIGLGRSREEERVKFISEPYPGRFTHQVLITSLAEVDDNLFDWLQEAYEFALHK